MNFKGEFETHITLALTGENEFQALREWSEPRHLKCTHIVLEKGVTASQPMLTQESVGTLEETQQLAVTLRDQCELADFPVCRVKLEVPPWNPGVPQTTADAHPSERYFEHHIELLIPSDSELHSLREAIKTHKAHLSRNARRTRSDGGHERFVTQRCYSVGRQEAKQAFDALMREVQSHAFQVLETEEEFVVYDSNLALDAGWIE